MNIGQIKVSAFEECGMNLRKNKYVNNVAKRARKISSGSNLQTSIQNSESVVKQETSMLTRFVDYIKKYF